MKVLAINASPRPDGNTAMLLQMALGPIAAEGIETELYQLGGQMIAGCKACYACFQNKDRRCVLTGDPVNDVILKMAGADGILLGSPTYFADITPELKALIDRAGLVGMASGGIFRRKVGAAVLAVRRGVYRQVHVRERRAQGAARLRIANGHKHPHRLIHGVLLRRGIARFLLALTRCPPV